MVKYLPDGQVAIYKVRLVAKGFSQIYGNDFFDTFSLVARISSIRVLFSIAVNRDWQMF